MQRSGVHLSVPSFPCSCDMQQVCCWVPDRRAISIDSSRHRHCTVLSSKCEQCHVYSWRRKLNADFLIVAELRRCDCMISAWCTMMAVLHAILFDVLFCLHVIWSSSWYLLFENDNWSVTIFAYPHTVHFRNCPLQCTAYTVKENGTTATILSLWLFWFCMAESQCSWVSCGASTLVELEQEEGHLAWNKTGCGQ